jgi:NAD(P)-dependent dehydrogenase (short-subunit alcohol dehydrogenase family)
MKIVVTGSSTGIGRALVLRLISEGHEVWGLARSDQSEFVASQHGAFRATRCDVGSWAEVEKAASEIESVWKVVDGLVCCAGTQGEVGPAVRADPKRWADTVHGNLSGTFFAIRAFYLLLSKAQRRSKIVCFSGGGSTKPRPHFSAYGVAKTGIVRLVETIAQEEAQAPLDINAIAPGAIATRLTDEVIALGPDIAGQAEFDAAIKQKAEGGASMERALDLIEWLLSPSSDGVSGKLISAPWDPWPSLGHHVPTLARTDVYTLRRVVPEDRGLKF